MYGRPVICSDIGGMAEKVRDGIDGLHFRAGDHDSLAEAIANAATSRDLWSRLRSRRPDVYTMDDQVTALTKLYEKLARRKQRSVKGARRPRTAANAAS